MADFMHFTNVVLHWDLHFVGAIQDWEFRVLDDFHFFLISKKKILLIREYGIAINREASVASSLERMGTEARRSWKVLLLRNPNEIGRASCRERV